MWLKVSMSLRIILNETHKRLLLLWDYKFDTLMQALIISLIFLGAIFFLGKERIDQQQLPGQFLGYVIWVYARMATKNLSDDIIAEAQAGTLEQMYMSPVRPELLLVGRMIAFTISTTLVICLIACVLVIPLHIDIPLRWGVFRSCW
ncbi:hypothetical protein EPA93_06270 [Ktedonosporobacter rubrisoli]|uniref:ABC transporter permease n=1 Tax=Ktedonosporobacter rubrisoli TaxID=2509675 RepID=A0A4P6JKV3_KTERU|nr:hypothetical protein [Ktedonosporobacter rubrisoli]QBD75630.1 hypothetical protein EPA93_06270 [Ktedonosporobacter rubrisoli]